MDKIRLNCGINGLGSTGRANQILLVNCQFSGTLAADSLSLGPLGQTLRAFPKRTSDAKNCRVPHTSGGAQRLDLTWSG